MTQNETLSTPVQIDTAIYEAELAVEKAQTDLKRHERRVGSLAHDAEAHSRAAKEFSDVVLVLEERKAQYTGWSRYYHVANPGGHIHTSMHCQSCFPGTRYMWRTDLSGLSAEEVVEREAYNACTFCMPIAPAEQKAARVRYNAEQKAARAAEKKAKADEKLRKVAERALKLMAKVDAVYEEMGEDWMASLPAHGPASLYHFVYGFGVYEGRKPLSDSVAIVLLDDDRQAREGSRLFGRDPREIINEARAAGLI